MRAYLKLFQKTIISYIFYTTEIVLRNLWVFLLILVSFSISFTMNSSLNVFDKTSLIIYLTISNFLNVVININSMRFVYEVDDLVVKGDIANHLIKPYSPLVYLFVKNLARALYEGIIVLVSLDVICKFMYNISILKLLHYQVLAVLMLPLPILYCFAMGTIFVSLAFYLEKSSHLYLAYSKLVTFIGGGIVPIALLKIPANLLPMYYMIGIIPDFLLGNISVKELSLWVWYYAILGVLAWFIYKRAIRKLEINGG